MSPADRVIVALDTPDPSRATELAASLGPVAGALKVGLELFNAVGPAVFARLRDAGARRIFYDAKFCDIPNTVAGAVRAAVANDLWMLNVHVLGGRRMLEAACDAARTAGDRAPKLIGVTVLTSLSEIEVREELGLPESVGSAAVRLAVLAKESGLDGVVASPFEAAAIRAACGPDFLIVTPGIRPSGPTGDDQRRVASPEMALAAGASHIVVGRPVTGASDPRTALEALTREIGAAGAP
jgi:orotidine-5'-phosphate decarboxylase